MDRPSTSKPRGVCKFYNTARGCRVGNDCKFLHGTEDKLSPYDKSKTCRYFSAGFCSRGDKCWFIHASPAVSRATDDDTENCSICFEKPVTYGLLTDCSHLFCLKCIREWRDPHNKSADALESGLTKKCPLCRRSSRFITPSSQFFRNGDPQKLASIEAYMASMGRVDCKYFARSSADERFCPFGKDCFYRHQNDDGSPHTFPEGVDFYMPIYRRRMHRSTSHPMNSLWEGWEIPNFRSLLARVAERLDETNDPIDTAPTHPDAARRTLQALVDMFRVTETGDETDQQVSDRLLAALTAFQERQDILDYVEAHPRPTRERREAHRTASLPPLAPIRGRNALGPDDEDDGDMDMPPLLSVSDSSDESYSSDEDEQDENLASSMTRRPGDRRGMAPPRLRPEILSSDSDDDVPPLHRITDSSDEERYDDDDGARETLDRQRPVSESSHQTDRATATTSQPPYLNRISALAVSILDPRAYRNTSPAEPSRVPPVALGDDADEEPPSLLPATDYTSRNEGSVVEVADRRPSVDSDPQTTKSAEVNLNPNPPFMTDGRGRVVYATPGPSTTRGSRRHPSSLVGVSTSTSGYVSDDERVSEPQSTPRPHTPPDTRRSIVGSVLGFMFGG